MRNPEKCGWAKKMHGVYICVGMCAPCERVDPKWCGMEDDNNLLELINEETAKRRKNEKRFSS